MNVTPSRMIKNLNRNVADFFKRRTNQQREKDAETYIEHYSYHIEVKSNGKRTYIRHLCADDVFRGHVLGRYIVRVEASSLSDLEVRTRAYISNVVSKGGRAFVVKGVSVERIREIETHLLTSAIRGLQSETY